MRAFRLSALLSRRSLLVIASLLGADVAAGQVHPETPAQASVAKPARWAEPPSEASPPHSVEHGEAHSEEHREAHRVERSEEHREARTVARSEELSPATEGVEQEAEILARIDPFDVNAHIPPFWIGPHYARRRLEPARRRRHLPARCHTTGGYREHCSGPRLVVTPSGAAAALAEHLGLGRDVTAMQLLGGRPFAPWLEAVRGLDPDRHLTHPVPEGHHGRGFGYTRGEAMAHVRHDGIDIGAPSGTSILAARGGLVAYTDNGLSGMGNLLILLHSDGDSTAYAHCERILVQPGQIVERGEHVADVGHTGFAAAPHLHFEWRQNGWLRDPARVLLRRDGR